MKQQFISRDDFSLETFAELILASKWIFVNEATK